MLLQNLQIIDTNRVNRWCKQQQRKMQETVVAYMFLIGYYQKCKDFLGMPFFAEGGQEQEIFQECFTM